MKIKAWDSDEAKDTAGRYSGPYLDRPVAEASWTKVSDTPIDGLSVYQKPETSSPKTPTNPSNSKRPSTSGESPTPNKKTRSRAPQQLEMGFQDD